MSGKPKLLIVEDDEGLGRQLRWAYEDYDVLIAADESDIFAPYLPYLTWDPRPVAGSAGLVPRSWHPAMEAWGGTQYQNRFERMANRPIREEDYQAWVALRIVGEAATRTRSADPAELRAFARRLAPVWAARRPAAPSPRARGLG